MDSLDSDIEEKILAKDGFCGVKMLGATSAEMLQDDVLEQADVVALWHTIQLDADLLRRLKKPPKVGKYLVIL